MSKKRKAIIIGVDLYKDSNLNDLKYAISDANRLSGLLRYLPGGGYDISFLSNPTAGDVTDCLDRVMLSLSAGDDFFFYFAGHGLQPHGSKQHLLLCNDAHRGILHGHGTNGSVPHTYLNDLTKRCGANMVFCFDACRTSLHADRESKAKMTGSSALRDIGIANQSKQRGTCMTLLSCSDGESAEESTELGGGLFTFALVDYMETCLKSNDSIILNSQLLQRVSNQMSYHRTHGTQTPVITSPGGKEFVLCSGTSRVEVQSVPIISSPSVDVDVDVKSEHIHQGAAKRDHTIKAGKRKVLIIKGVEHAFRWCPPGTFIMGSSPKEKKRNVDEIQHQVTLSHGFWLGETPITQSQWESVMRSNPSTFQGPNLPVVTVSWNDCEIYLKNLNDLPLSTQAGYQFSLPSEAQWEYATRAEITRGDSLAYHCGEAYSIAVVALVPLFVSIIGWCAFWCKWGEWPEIGAFVASSMILYFIEFIIFLIMANEGIDVERYGWHKGQRTGRKRKNRWGLYDMHGNVWEWCSDVYGDYPCDAVTDPTGPNKGSHRVIRGGSYCTSKEQFCRFALRNSGTPKDTSNDIGLRLCLVSRQEDS